MTINFPTDPKVNQTFNDAASGGTGKTWQWNGISWNLFNLYVPTIPANTITAADIADFSVTTSKIVDGAVTLDKIDTVTSGNSYLVSAGPGLNPFWKSVSSTQAGQSYISRYVLSSSAVSSYEIKNLPTNKSVLNLMVTGFRMNTMPSGATRYMTIALSNNNGTSYGPAANVFASTQTGNSVVWGSTTPTTPAYWAGIGQAYSPDAPGFTISIYFNNDTINTKLVSTTMPSFVPTYGTVVINSIPSFSSTFTTPINAIKFTGQVLSAGVTTAANIHAFDIFSWNKDLY